MEKAKVTFENEGGKKIIMEITQNNENLDVQIRFEPERFTDESDLSIGLFNLFLNEINS